MKNKILIIDDSKEILFAISEFFRIKNWDVFTALSMEEALKIVNTKKLDIIIIDNKINIEIKIKKYSEITKEKKIEEKNYKKIKFHIELYKIKITLTNRAKAVYETTLLDEIKLGRKQTLKENQVKLKLKAIQNKEYIDSAEYLDEEFFKQKIIDRLLNSNNSSELIKICTDEVNEKIKKRENFVGDNI